eukprot:999036-Rhodomonas_salina.1
MVEHRPAQLSSESPFVCSSFPAATAALPACAQHMSRHGNPREEEEVKIGLNWMRVEGRKEATGVNVG